MKFESDNTHIVHAKIMAAIMEANHATMASYGADLLSQRAEKALSILFECKVRAYLVTTGTAANALALSALTPPFGAVLCHDEAHIMVDECGAPELFSGGAKLLGIAGDGGKISPDSIKAVLDGLIRGEHDPKPHAVSLTQSTEYGTLYTIDEITAISTVAHERGLKMHMDGARFANAVASTGCSPAQMSWQAGIDVMSFGATKNGAMALEAVVFFNTCLAKDFEYRRMRAGQLLSKGRFLGAQMLSYLEDGLWLENATSANNMAQKLAAGLSEISDIRIALPVEANEVFAIMPKAKMAALHAQGAEFHQWPGKGPGTDTMADDEVLARFVTAFATKGDDVDKLIAHARG